MGTLVRLSAAALASLVMAAAPTQAVGPSQKDVSADPKALAIHLASEAAGSPAILEAVKEQNVRTLNQLLPEIRQAELAWRTTKGVDAKMRALMESPCAGALRALQGRSTRIADVTLLDTRGVVVCMTSRAAHFHWGEQPEFSHAFNGSLGGVFVGKPVFDEAAGDYVVPVSVPVVAGRQAIGVISLRVLAAQ
jgi:hypothetical protein